MSNAPAAQRWTAKRRFPTRAKVLVSADELARMSATGQIVLGAFVADRGWLTGEPGYEQYDDGTWHRTERWQRTTRYCRLVVRDAARSRRPLDRPGFVRIEAWDFVALLEEKGLAAYQIQYPGREGDHVHARTYVHIGYAPGFSPRQVSDPLRRVRARRRASAA